MTNTTDPIKLLEAEADACLTKIEKYIERSEKYTIKAIHNPEYSELADEADKKLSFYTEKAIRYNNAVAELESFRRYKIITNAFDWCIVLVFHISTFGMFFKDVHSEDFRQKEIKQKLSKLKELKISLAGETQ